MPLLNWVLEQVRTKECKMQVTGKCHCEAISFQAEVDPGRAVLCHCTDCRVLSGGPYRSIIQTRETDFELLSGKPKMYYKYGESGNRRELAFCDTCGSQLYATSVGDEPNRFFGLRTGILDQCEDLKPTLQVWCRSEVPWAQDVSQIQRVDKVPGA